jgi:LysM repeat protein
MLTLEYREWYQVKEGQTVAEIARVYGVSARLLAQENGLKEEPRKGRLLKIPKMRGNAYTAREGDTKTLLCGSEENFKQRNGTMHVYPGMRVIL